MVKMAALDGHFSLEELRGAVESISGSGIEAGSPVFPPSMDDEPSEVSRLTN